jgi:hypothetical protein
MTTVDITDWHNERIAGFLEAIKGDHPNAAIECIVRHHDTDRVGQLSLSLTDEPASDFTARRCETCQTITVSKIIPLASLKTPKTLDAAAERGEDSPNCDGPHPH